MNTEKKILPPEERQIINTMSSLAALLGNSLYYYGRTALNITFEGYEEIEAEARAIDEQGIFTLAEDPKEEDLAASRKKGTRVDEAESPGTQFIQVLTLLRPEVKALFGESAIYQIFQDTLSRLERQGETLEEQLDGLNLITISGIWIITKRVFSLGHPNDCFKMIDCLLGLMKSEDQKPLQLDGISDSDFVNVASFCSTYFFDGAYSFDQSKHPVEEKIPSQQPDEPTSITTFISTDKLYLPSAKVFRKQQEIAAAGKLKVNVGRENHPVTVTASITDEEGKSLKLTEFEMNIEAAIGQMWQMNGYKTFTCTPSQIYRVYAGMEPGDPLSSAQIEKVVKAMDKLIHTPATLDFAEQLEQHTKLKKREGFDYSEAKRIGNLITGVHDQVRRHNYNGVEISDTFTIHEMPMFYAYSYAIGQLYTVSKYLLTGETPPDPEAQKKTTKKRTLSRRLSSDDIDLRRYLLRYIEFQRTEKEKRDQKYKRQLKPIPKTFEFFLPFETIAKEIGYEADSPKKIRMLREQTFDFVQEQAKSRNIQKADYYKKGKALHGVHVWL